MNLVVRILTWLLIIVVIGLPITAVLRGWVGTEYWPLSQLRVSAPFVQIHDSDIRKALQPYAKQGYFAINLHDAQTAVSRLPWVKHAVVNKKWPDILEVYLEEYKPVAYWGDEMMLSEHGELFLIPPGLFHLPLPVLNGPKNKSAEIMAFYKETTNLFKPLNIKVTKVIMDDRGSWSLMLDSGTNIILGRRDIQQRLSRFIYLMPQLLASQPLFLEYADLRYTHGFSLRWRAVTSAKTAKVADIPPSARSGEHLSQASQ